MQIAKDANADDAKYFFADDKSKAGVIYCDGSANNCIGYHTHTAGTLWLSTAGKSTLEALTGITVKQTPNATTPANYDGALTLPAANNRTYSIDGGATWKTPTAAEITAGKFDIAFTNRPLGHKFDVVYKLLTAEGQNPAGVPSLSAYVTLENKTGPSITIGAQSGTATYGTAGTPTFTVTNSNFGGAYPAFAPQVEWVGTAPTGVTTAFSDDKGTLTMNTTAVTPAGEYKFKVVSAMNPSTDGNYESAEATLKVDRLTVIIKWGPTTIPYNGSAQTPTATVSNKVGDDDVNIFVNGVKTDIGSDYTAYAAGLTGPAYKNYTLMGSTQDQTKFSITAKTLIVNDGTLEVKKAYDGNTDAGTVTSGKLGLTGVVASDTDNVSVKIDTISNYADANVGKNKTVTLTISLEGAAAGNYTLDGVTSYTFTKAEITKVAYTGTPATAPDSTPEKKGDKSITIKPVTPPANENVEYAVSKTNTPPTSDSDWQDSTTFDNLDPNTEYYFFARVKENDNHAAGDTSSGTSITTDKSAYNTKSSAPDGTPASKSDTSITLKPVTPPAGETVEYGIENSDGTITWQDSTTFNSLTANTEYKFYTRVKENATHKAGPASDSTAIKTDLSDAQKLAAAKIAVTNALNNFTATNATDADTVMALVNKALTDAGITGVTPSWDASGAFSKNDATEDNPGSVTGKIKLTVGSESDTVALDKTIAQLPSDPAEKVRLVKAAIEAALNAYTATNATTADDIKAIVDKANTDSGVTGVTVAWKTPSDFNNKNSTNSENGKVTGTFDLSCTKGGSTATDTVSVNRPIERSDQQKLADAKAKAEAALAAMTATNDTTADDVMTAINNALSGTGVTAEWKAGSPVITKATVDTAGSITGTMILKFGSETIEVTVSKSIAKLPSNNVLVDDSTGTKVEYDDGSAFDSSIVLSVTSKPQAEMDKFKDNVEKAAPGLVLGGLYDVKLLKDGVAIQPDGKVKVSIPLTDKMKSMTNLQIVYIDDNGNITIIPSEVKDGMITFITDHFSYYGIIGKVKATDPGNNNGGGNNNNNNNNNNSNGNTNSPQTGDSSPVLLLVLMILVSGTALIVLSKKRKVLKHLKK